MNVNKYSVVPRLIEPRTKFYLKTSLKNSREFKDYYITIIVNILLLFVFILVCTLVLYYRYKGKPTFEDQQRKENEKKKYIFTKIQQFSLEKQKESQGLITNLPVNHPQVSLK